MSCRDQHSPRRGRRWEDAMPDVIECTGQNIHIQPRFPFFSHLLSSSHLSVQSPAASASLLVGIIWHITISTRCHKAAGPDSSGQTRSTAPDVSFELDEHGTALSICSAAYWSCAYPSCLFHCLFESSGSEAGPCASQGQSPSCTIQGTYIRQFWKDSRG